MGAGLAGLKLYHGHEVNVGRRPGAALKAPFFHDPLQLDIFQGRALHPRRPVPDSARLLGEVRPLSDPSRPAIDSVPGFFALQSFRAPSVGAAGRLIGRETLNTYAYTFKSMLTKISDYDLMFIVAAGINPTAT